MVVGLDDDYIVIIEIYGELNNERVVVMSAYTGNNLIYGHYLLLGLVLTVVGDLEFNIGGDMFIVCVYYCQDPFERLSRVDLPIIIR